MAAFVPDANLDVANFDPFESGAIALDDASQQSTFDPFSVGAIEEPPSPAFFQTAADEEGATKGRARSAGASFMQGGGVGAGQSISGFSRLLDTLGAGATMEAAMQSGDPTGELAATAQRLRSRTGQQREADIAADPIYKFGQELAAGAKEAFPENPKFRGEFFTSTIPSSAGQMVPTVAAGMVNPVLAAGQYGLSAGQAGAEESIAAGDLKDADKVFLAYLGLGAISELALGVPANVVRYLRAARTGGVDRAVAGETIRRLMLKGATREAGQESLEQIGQNVVAQETFDPNRKIMAGVPESAAAGALLGGAVSGVAAATGAAGDARSARRSSGATPAFFQPETPIPPTEPATTPEEQNDAQIPSQQPRQAPATQTEVQGASGNVPAQAPQAPVLTPPLPRILTKAIQESVQDYQTRIDHFRQTGGVLPPIEPTPDVAVAPFIEPEAARQKLWENMQGREMDIPAAQWLQPASPHLRLVLGANAPSWRDLNFSGVVTASSNPDGSYRVKVIPRITEAPSAEPRTPTAVEQPTNIPVSGVPNALPPPVTETPVLGGSEANLPPQQREQSRRNNEAQAAQMRAELEAMGVTVPEKAVTPLAEKKATLESIAATHGTDWKMDRTGMVSPTGFNKRFSPERLAELKQQFKDAGLSIIQSTLTGERMKRGFKVADNDNGRARLETEIVKLERAVSDQKKKAASDEEAAKKQAELDAADPDALAWMNSVFGDGFANPYNKLKLSNFLTGKDKKFGGATSAQWQDGVKKLGATNLDEIKAAYVKSKPSAVVAGETSTPVAEPEPKPLVDQAITKIEDLEKRIRGSGENLGTGIPQQVLLIALQVARNALQAGRTAAQAIDAAIAKIRESIATFDEAEVRATLERELASAGTQEPVADENLQHEEEPRAQVAGIPELGQIRPTEHLPEILAAVREKVIDARKPPAETLEQAWNIARQLTDPSPEVRTGHALKYHQTIGGADAGLVTLKQEIMLVGLKQALAGDDSLLRYTFDNSADFQTSVGGGATAVGRSLRGEQGEFYGALYKSLRDIFGDQKLSNAQIASALDRDTFFDLIAGLKDMKLSPEEIETVLETGKTPEGDTLRDILERDGKAPPAVPAAESAEQVAERILDRYARSQSDTLSWTPKTWNTVREVFKGLLNGDVTHDEFRGTLDSLKANRAITESLIGVAMRELDIRKQLVFVRARERRDAAWQREMENLATQGQRSAEAALRNLELKNAGAEWLKPGNRNRVRDILNKAFSPSEPILQDPRPWIDALRDELESAGVDFPTATQLAQQVYQARETQWVNANLRAMERAAESGSIRSLVEAVIADPYRAQNSPKWLRKTAVNWFMSNGLTPERAEAAYKLFEPQFRKALADAQEKVARQVLESKRKDPRTIKELVTLIRSGVLDLSRNWLDTLAERRGWKKPTAAQYGKLEELDEQLAQPELSPLERRDIVEQQHRIIRHLGKLDGQAARTVAESFLASLLTGFRTFTVQLTAAVAGLRDVAIASASNPTNTFQFMRAMKNAIVNNLKSQLNYTWQKGISAFHINEVEQNFSQLERLHEDVMAAFKSGTPAQKAAAAAKYLFAQQRWVLRALNAMDSASAAVIREYKLAYYSSLAFKEAGLDTRMISELLDAQQQMRQAEYEKWINAGLDHDRAHLRANATVDRTTRDFLANKGVDDRLIDAVFQSAENDSYGVVGRLAPGVQETGKDVSEGLLSRFTMNPIVEFVGKQKAKGGWSTIAAQTMFGFVAIPWRATRFASTFMWYGLVRGGIDAYRTKRGLPTFWKQSYANVLQSRARLREAIAGTVVGVAAGLLLANTSDDDPEDKGFKVFATGAGPTNKNLKDAWIKRGFQPYALNFKINGRIASIPLTRIGEFIMYPFIIAAAIDDAKWKQKERAMTGKPPAEPVSLYASTLVGEHLAMMGQRGLLQTAGQLYQSMQQTGSFGKGVARLAAGTAAGIAIPFKQLLSSISDMFVGPLDNSSAQAIVANAFPIIGLPFQNKAVNRFGDQMYDRSWYGRIARTGVPVAFQVDSAPENQKLYTLLVSDGAAPPELRRGNLENKYGPLTDDQFADFAKKSGALLKQSTLSKLSDLQQAAPAEVKSFLSKAASQADKTAAAALGLAPLAKPEAATTASGATLRAATSTATGAAAAALPVMRRSSTGRLRASLSRRTRTPALGRVRSRLGRTRLATMRVPRLRSSRLRASLSRPRRGRFSVRSRMARTRRPRVRYV